MFTIIFSRPVTCITTLSKHFEGFFFRFVEAWDNRLCRGSTWRDMCSWWEEEERVLEWVSWRFWWGGGGGEGKGERERGHWRELWKEMEREGLVRLRLGMFLEGWGERRLGLWVFGFIPFFMFLLGLDFSSRHHSLYFSFVSHDLFIYFVSRISIILDCKAFFPLFSPFVTPLLHQPPYQATSVFKSSFFKSTVKLHLIS